MKRVYFESLTDDEKELFTETFYRCASEVMTRQEKWDDLTSAEPWGCPWFWGGRWEDLEGDTVEEWAESFWETCKDEITGYLMEDRKRAEEKNAE